jgi:hypothetical protein
LLENAEITLQIQEEQELLAHRQHRHGWMGPKAGLTGQTQRKAGGLHAQQRLGAAGGGSIGQAWDLPTERAELIGVVITELKASPQTGGEYTAQGPLFAVAGGERD